MTLDEAIRHAEEVAAECDATNPKCAKEHKDLATWLRELKDRRDGTDRDLIRTPPAAQAQLLRVYQALLAALDGTTEVAESAAAPDRWEPLLRAVRRLQVDGGAWKRLALALDGRQAAPERVSRSEIDVVRAELRGLGIDPATGERLRRNDGSDER